MVGSPTEVRGNEAGRGFLNVRNKEREVTPHTGLSCGCMLTPDSFPEQFLAKGVWPASSRMQREGWGGYGLGGENEYWFRKPFPGVPEPVLISFGNICCFHLMFPKALSAFCSYHVARMTTLGKVESCHLGLGTDAIYTEDFPNRIHHLEFSLLTLRCCVALTCLFLNRAKRFNYQVAKLPRVLWKLNCKSQVWWRTGTP